MPAHSEIDTRMKEYYENRYRYKLTRRTPVIVRIDGKAFHTFTRGFEKPFDYLLIDTMQATTKYLCEHVEGCVFGYTQSDEISLLLIDYKRLNSAAYFDYNVQKISSITASMATLAFNRIFSNRVYEIDDREDIDDKYLDTLYRATTQGAMFDSRCFNIPKEEVCNYFYSRQIDAIRNSKEMAGRAYFSANELHKVNTTNIVSKLLEEKGVDWNKYPTPAQRGTSFYKDYMDFVRIIPKTEESIKTTRSYWKIDKECPLFNENRMYIEKWLKPEDE